MRVCRHQDSYERITDIRTLPRRATHPCVVVKNITMAVEWYTNQYYGTHILTHSRDECLRMLDTYNMMYVTG